MPVNNKAYWNQSVAELRQECKRRRILMRGNKPDVIERLIAWDEQQSKKEVTGAKLPADDMIVTTAGRDEDNPPQKFIICGGCEQWKRRCICRDGENTEEPGQGGTRNPKKKSAKAAGPGQNKRDGRYIHHGTFV